MNFFLLQSQQIDFLLLSKLFASFSSHPFVVAKVVNSNCINLKKVLIKKLNHKLKTISN